MTMEQHYSLAKEHRDKSIAALNEFTANHNWDKWQEYKTEYRLANKHYGIASGMHTKKIRKWNPEY